MLLNCPLPRCDGTSRCGTQQTPHDTTGGQWRPKRVRLHLSLQATASTKNVDTGSQAQPDQRRQQQQQQHCLPQNIEFWAAEEVVEVLMRLRTNDGQALPQSVTTDMQRALTAYLSKPCSSEAAFRKRQSMALAMEQLLECVLSAGFTANHARKLALQPKLMPIDSARVYAILKQLQKLGNMTEQQAVSVLGMRPELLTSRPEHLPARFNNVQQLTGMTNTQVSKMICGSSTAIRCSSNKISASMEALAGLGYSSGEICTLLQNGSGLLDLNPKAIEDKHAQLAAMFSASSADVRKFVGKQPTIMKLNLSSPDVTSRIQLWLEETARPHHSILAVPQLFQLNLGRTAARICFLNRQGHTLTTSAYELWVSFAKFSRRLDVSEAEYAAWREEWLETPKGKRYGDARSKF